MEQKQTSFDNVKEIAALMANGAVSALSEKSKAAMKRVEAMQGRLGAYAQGIRAKDESVSEVPAEVASAEAPSVAEEKPAKKRTKKAEEKEAVPTEAPVAESAAEVAPSKEEPKKKKAVKAEEKPVAEPVKEAVAEEQSKPKKVEKPKEEVAQVAEPVAEKPAAKKEEPVAAPVEEKSERSAEAAKPEKKTEKKAERKEPVKAEKKQPEAPVAEEKPAEEKPKEEGSSLFKKPLRKISLEELAEINRPKPKKSPAPQGGIQRSFIGSERGERKPRGDRPGDKGAPRGEGGRQPGARPQGNAPRSGGMGHGGMTASAIPAKASAPTKNYGNKKKTPEKTSAFEDKKTNKRTLIKKGLIQTQMFDEDRMGSRKVKTKKKQQTVEERIKIEHAVVTSENFPIKVLSEKLGISATEITKRLFK
ncbi:MAG: hypothetical protein IJF71_05240, partial [Clostridia bacterium]|nr:hypothetical protein [Clostridia bacterium]